MLGRWGGFMVTPPVAVQPSLKVAASRDQLSALQLCVRITSWSRECPGGDLPRSRNTKPTWWPGGVTMGVRVRAVEWTPSVSPGAGGTWALISRALSALRPSGSVADLPAHPVLRRCVPPERDATTPFLWHSPLAARPVFFF